MDIGYLKSINRSWGNDSNFIKSVSSIHSAAFASIGAELSSSRAQSGHHLTYYKWQQQRQQDLFRVQRLEMLVRKMARVSLAMDERRAQQTADEPLQFLKKDNPNLLQLQSGARAAETASALRLTEVSARASLASARPKLTSRYRRPSRSPTLGWTASTAPLRGSSDRWTLSRRPSLTSWLIK